MTKAIRSALTLLGIGAALLPAHAAPRATAHRTTTRLYQTSYKGWPDAFLLTNGTVDVVLVPAIGRIMAYQFAGQPQTNMLWNNPALAGRPLPFAVPYPPRATEWVNYGGDKLWPAPQDDWAQRQRQAGNWPPDPQMDYGPYRVSRIPNGLRLTGPLSRNRQVRPIRDFVLAPGSTQLTLRETFLHPAPTAPGMPAAQRSFPLGLWNIAQARPDATVFLPLSPASRFPNGYVVLAGKEGAANWQAGDGLLAVTSHTVQGNKVGVDAAQGWIGALYGGNLVFTEQFALDPKGVYPDQNTSLQVYSQGGTDGYLELEALGPLADGAAGQAQSRTLTWTLRRLPHAPRSQSEARRLMKSLVPPSPAEKAR